MNKPGSRTISFPEHARSRACSGNEIGSRIAVISIINIEAHRRHLGTQGPVSFAGVRISFLTMFLTRVLTYRNFLKIRKFVYVLETGYKHARYGYDNSRVTYMKSSFVSKSEHHRSN